MTYALGRGVEDYDSPAVRAIVRDAAPEDYRFSSVHSRHRATAPVSDEESRRAMIITQDGAAAAHVPARDGRDASRCRCSTRWCRRCAAERGTEPVDAAIGFFYMPNGVAMNHTGVNYWTPKTDGHALRALADPDAARAVPRSA